MNTVIANPGSGGCRWSPGKTFHFAEGFALAHSIVQAHVSENDRRDRAYDALGKIAHAGWDYVDAMGGTATRWYATAFPCLVVDPPLLAANYDANTDGVRAKEIKYGRLYWRGCRHGTNVDVVQASAVQEYAELVSSSFVNTMRVLRALFGA